jgi:hypothetical protein
MRIFDNTSNVSKAVLLLRVRTLDALADLSIYETAREDLSVARYVSVDSILTDSQLENLFSTPETLTEQTIIANYLSAANNFNNLPNWSTWTAAETETNITNLIFNGNTQAQQEAVANALPFTQAGMRQGFVNAVDNIIAIRSILVQMAKAIVYIRDYIIKTRK